MPLGPRAQSTIENGIRNGKIEIERQSLKSRLIPKGSVPVGSLPGAPKMSTQETTSLVLSAQSKRPPAN